MLGSKGLSLVFQVRGSQADNETNREGEWYLERAIEGEYGSRDGEEVGEELKTGKPNHDRRDQAIDLPEVPRGPRRTNAH